MARFCISLNNCTMLMCPCPLFSFSPIGSSSLLYTSPNSELQACHKLYNANSVKSYTHQEIQSGNHAFLSFKYKEKMMTIAKTSQQNWTLISAAKEGSGDIGMGVRKDKGKTKSFYKWKIPIQWKSNVIFTPTKFRSNPPCLACQNSKLPLEEPKQNG